jgi:dynein heavy chain
MSESNKFDNVDKSFKSLMDKTVKSPNVLKIVRNTHKLYENLKANNETMEEIQKNLETYLETKRKAFPRFYFLSNDELLEILAKSNELNIIQQHLRTCFDNIQSLDIVDGMEIVAMNSSEGEKVGFWRNVKIRNSIETWML